MTVTDRRVRGGIGESVVRPDGVPKVTGNFAYASDLTAEGMLWGATLRSPFARARLVRLDTAAALAIPGVHAVLTQEDVPGRPTFGQIVADQPVLVDGEARFWGEPAAIVAADDPDTARRAVAAIDVEWEELEPLVDMEEGGVDLWVTSQWTHEDHDQIWRSLDVEPGQIRQHPSGIGGAFGAREDMSLHIHVCMLALRTGRPVKMVYNRAESFPGHVHRHPARMWFRH